MGLFDRCKKKSEIQNARPNSSSKMKHFFSSERKYIYFYGSDTEASHIVGNIEVIDGAPYIITNAEGGREKTEWSSVIEKAKVISLPTYFWIKNINEENWQQYAFTFRPHEQPQDINSVRIFGFPNESPYVNPVFCEVVINKSDRNPYIRYSVANGHSGHDPWLVSISQPITFEDIRILARELKLLKYTDINEVNWIDKIEIYGGANVYQIPSSDTLFDVLMLLARKQLHPSEIECIPIFANQPLEKQTIPTEIFNSTFLGDWRMYSFKIKCKLTDDFTVHIDGLKKEAVASWPINIKELLS